MPLAEIVRLISDNNSESICSSLSCLEQILSDHAIYEQSPDLLHKFRVKISSLFKSKTTFSRLLACKLAETSAKSHWDTLHSHGYTWVGLMLTIISSQDNPDSVRRAAIESCSTIFALTKGKPDLTRTITTRALPTFLRSLCEILRSRSSISAAAIISLNTTLIDHPTTFRFVANDYHNSLLSIFAQAREVGLSNMPMDIGSAARGFVLLHRAATKGNEAIEWSNALQHVIQSLELQIDGTFRSTLFNSSESIKPDGLVDINDDLFKNLRNISILFILLETFFKVPSKTRVTIPLGNLVDFLRTILVASPVLSGTLGYNTVVRSSCISCFRALTETLGHSILPFVDDLFWAFSGAMKTRLPDDIKLQLLDLSTVFLKDILKHVAVSTKNPVSIITEEALKLLEYSDSADKSTAPDFTQNPGVFKRHRQESSVKIIDEFLIAVIVALPDLPLSIRGKIDNHFLVTSFKKGIEMSAIYPGSAKYSILPMAINTCDDSVTLEILMHPRLPLSQAYKEPTDSYNLLDEHVESQQTTETKTVEAYHVYDEMQIDQKDQNIDSSEKSGTRANFSPAKDLEPIVRPKANLESTLHETSQEIDGSQVAQKDIEPYLKKETFKSQEDFNDAIHQDPTESDIEIPEIDIGYSDDE